MIIAFQANRINRKYTIDFPKIKFYLIKIARQIPLKKL
jgi:hypothetical protein